MSIVQASQPGPIPMSSSRRPVAALPAREVHRRLQSALDEMQRAEKSAVLWFAEILHRKLYRSLGYSSIHLYAREALGFSTSKTAQFLRLSQSLEKLPALKRALASGDLPWTKAREVVKVATARTQSRWIATAQSTSRRQLEEKVRHTRAVARARRSADPRQTSLAGLDAGSLGDGVAGNGRATPDSRGPGASPGLREKGREPVATIPSSGRRPMDVPMDAPMNAPMDAPVNAPVNAPMDAPMDAPMNALVDVPVDALVDVPVDALVEVPVELRLRFTPEQYARYEALMERARRQKEGGSREDLVLAGLLHLVEANDLRSRTTNRNRRAAGARGDREVQDGGMPTPAGGRVERAVSSKRDAAGCTRVHDRSPYQVVVYQCANCRTGSVNTTRGRKEISRATLEAILCDARIALPGARNQATVPPRLRRATLERDGYRCCVAGCMHTRFLNVHHVVPREANGPNALSNLVTLCAGCHELLHERSLAARQVELVKMIRGIEHASGREGERGSRTARDPAKARAGQSGRTQSGRTQSGRAQSGRTQSGRTESGRRRGSGAGPKRAPNRGS
jgi:hypothetical protein